ncbi:hypothetical protein GCM10007979_36250 [Nocardioides albus]|nr:hypothetical protein GCM10007979_36250 [Nocardioides albus]
MRRSASGTDSSSSGTVVGDGTGDEEGTGDDDGLPTGSEDGSPPQPATRARAVAVDRAASRVRTQSTLPDGYAPLRPML